MLCVCVCMHMCVCKITKRNILTLITKGTNVFPTRQIDIFESVVFHLGEK